MITKIFPVRNLLGTLRYVAERPGAEFFGGNLAGRAPAEWHAEIAAQHCLIPSVAVEASHFAIALLPWERLGRRQWRAVEQRLASGTGYADHPRASFLHQNPAGTGEHLHLVCGNVSYHGIRQGQRHHAIRLRDIANRLETDYGLSVLRPATGMASRTDGEWRAADRAGQPSERQHLQRLVDRTARPGLAIAAFVAALEASGVAVKAHIRGHGQVNGLSYQAGRYCFSGMGLGTDFTWPGLLRRRRLLFDEAADLPVLMAATDRWRQRFGGGGGGGGNRQSAAAGREPETGTVPPGGEPPPSAVLRRLLEALACPHYDLRVLDATSGNRRLERPALTIEELLAALPRLASENAGGGEILFRPAVAGDLILLDAPQPRSLETAAVEGFDMAAVVAVGIEPGGTLEVWLRSAAAGLRQEPKRRLFHQLHRHFRPAKAIDEADFGHLPGFVSPLAQRLGRSARPSAVALVSAAAAPAGTAAIATPDPIEPAPRQPFEDDAGPLLDGAAPPLLDTATSPLLDSVAPTLLDTATPPLLDTAARPLLDDTARPWPDDTARPWHGTVAGRRQLDDLERRAMRDGLQSTATVAAAGEIEELLESWAEARRRHAETLGQQGLAGRLQAAAVEARQRSEPVPERQRAEASTQQGATESAEHVAEASTERGAAESAERFAAESTERGAAESLALATAWAAETAHARLAERLGLIEVPADLALPTAAELLRWRSVVEAAEERAERLALDSATRAARVEAGVAVRTLRAELDHFASQHGLALEAAAPPPSLSDDRSWAAARIAIILPALPHWPARTRLPAASQPTTAPLAASQSTTARLATSQPTTARLAASQSTAALLAATPPTTTGDRDLLAARDAPDAAAVLRQDAGEASRLAAPAVHIEMALLRRELQLSREMRSLERAHERGALRLLQLEAAADRLAARAVSVQREELVRHLGRLERRQMRLRRRQATLTHHRLGRQLDRHAQSLIEILATAHSAGASNTATAPIAATIADPAALSATAPVALSATAPVALSATAPVALSAARPAVSAVTPATFAMMLTAASAAPTSLAAAPPVAQGADLAAAVGIERHVALLLERSAAAGALVAPSRSADELPWRRRISTAESGLRLDLRVAAARRALERSPSRAHLRAFERAVAVAADHHRRRSSADLAHAAARHQRAAQRELLQAFASPHARHALARYRAATTRLAAALDAGAGIAGHSWPQALPVLIARLRRGDLSPRTLAETRRALHPRLPRPAAGPTPRLPGQAPARLAEALADFERQRTAVAKAAARLGRHGRVGAHARDGHERPESRDRHQGGGPQSSGRHESPDRHQSSGPHESSDRYESPDRHQSSGRHESSDRYESPDRHQGSGRPESSDRHESRDRHAGRHPETQHGFHPDADVLQALSRAIERLQTAGAAVERLAFAADLAALRPHTSLPQPSLAALVTDPKLATHPHVQLAGWAAAAMQRGLSPERIAEAIQRLPPAGLAAPRWFSSDHAQALALAAARIGRALAATPEP